MSKEPVILTANSSRDIPEDFTGVAIHPGGGKYWYKNRILHRVDGPAYENTDGYKQWWISGRYVADNGNFNRLENNYILVERGIPTDIMFGELEITMAKLLTANGTIFVCDNLPGMELSGND
jgi:hypothetical protein